MSSCNGPNAKAAVGISSWAEGQASPRTGSNRGFHLDKVNRTAGHIIFENRDEQPAGLVGLHIKVGAPCRQHWSPYMRRMPVNHMTVAMAAFVVGA